ncbi:hypothetical protein PMSD_09445 [Paenibacillus macquariensis subsp. defensor]|nr:hypothetical protein PMSD_09445 [Paenibacillus macquariensis subsp. defensor]
MLRFIIRDSQETYVKSNKSIMFLNVQNTVAPLALMRSGVSEGPPRLHQIIISTQPIKGCVFYLVVSPSGANPGVQSARTKWMKSIEEKTSNV